VKKPHPRANFPALGAVASAISAVIGGVAMTDLAHAQAGATEEITVTGSRIVRRDFEANSPIMTIESGRFEESSTISLESVLNQLPQFTPAITQFNVGSEFGVVGTSFFSEQLAAGATRTPGQATLSLRGLGPNRNLVLLDGRRATPLNAGMAVSINTIPSAAIARVESITGGASSVYGADAVAGVVNFITKRDFEGVDVDAQISQTAEGDGTELRFSTVFGANSADGRGNVLLGFERSRRDQIFAHERDYRMRGFVDPSSLSQTDFYSAAGYSPVPANMHNPAVLADIFGVAPGVLTTGGQYYMNSDGTLYKETADGNFRYGEGFLNPQDGLPWRFIEQSNASSNGQLRQNEPHELLQIPLDRYSLFGRGHIDVSDNLRVFGQVMYSESTTRQRQAASPMLGGWRTQVPHGDGIYAPSVDGNGNTLPEYLPGGLFGLDCGPVGGCTKSEAFPKPLELQMLLDSRPDPEADAELRQTLMYMGPRRSYAQVQSYQLVGGFEGDLPIRDWSWELYGSVGSTFTENTYGGAVSLERYRLLMRQPNYGRGFVTIGNQLGAGFGSGSLSCTSGLPAVYGVSGYYEGFEPSQDCKDAIIARAKNSGEMRQNIVEYNMQGGLAEMPAGELRFALGAGYRENKFDFNADTLNSQASVLDQLAGFFPLGDAHGTTEARELYGELLVPVVADVAGARELNLELGYRSTDNKPSNDVNTWKALIDWRVVDRFRVRGGRQVANRAPNIGELFQSREQFAPFSLFQGDPCSELNPASLPYTANPTRNTAGAQAAANVKALCEQLMGTAGAAAYYGGDTPQPNGFVSPRISNLSGNADLRSEEATTTTLGVVANITDQATLTFDYWRIELDDMIAPQVPDTLYRECLSGDTNPSYSPLHPSCALILRNPASGAVATVDVTYSNEAAADLSGYDVQFDWRSEVGPGMMTLSVLATITGDWKTQVNADSPWLDFKGTTGPSDVRGVNQFAYDYRLFTTLGYNTGNWSGSLRWRHLPSIDPEGTIRTQGVQYHTTPSYDIFDVSGRYSFSNNWDLRFGIDNLLDKDPPIVNLRTVAEGFTQTGVTNAAFYDALGRRFYVGMKFQF
jgi:iron complex outermembrane recepter protein